VSDPTWSPLWEDLDLVIAVRNEIEHFLPRPITTPVGLPTWLTRLVALNVLTDSMSPAALPDGTILSHPLGERLKSYALAYWAFERVEAAVMALDQYLHSGPLDTSIAANFSAFGGLWAPSDLPRHDATCSGSFAKAMLIVGSGTFL
jgi:hypothetical protein